MINRAIEDHSNAQPATDAELDELARVSASDVERARSRWKQDAPRELKNLLDAEPHGVPPDEEI